MWIRTAYRGDSRTSQASIPAPGKAPAPAPPQVQLSDGAIFETPVNSDAEEDAAAGPPPRPPVFEPREGTAGCSEVLDRKKAPKTMRDALTMRRTSTFFPEELDADAVGAWRMTRVPGVGAEQMFDHELDEERQRAPSSSWLLVGRRHSVDERREQVEVGKRLFLRNLAEEVDIPFGQRADSQGMELADVEARLKVEVARQVELVTAAKDFWGGSFASSRTYLSSLERLAGAPNTSLLPAEMGQCAAEQVTHARRALERSEAWASWLPRVADCHAAAVDELNRAVARAMQGAQTATEKWRNARHHLWPKSMELPGGGGDLTPPNVHSADSGPQDRTCLWLAACRYLVACENVDDSFEFSFALLHRQTKQAALLSRWLDDVLHCGGVSESSNSPAMMAEIPSQEPASPSFQRKSEPLIKSVDLATLVVHEINAEVCREYPRDTSSDSVWVAVHVVLTVDLQLHLWERPQLNDHMTTAPTDSVQLLRECNRPVAVRSLNDKRVVQIAVRPDQNRIGLLANLERMLWNRTSPYLWERTSPIRAPRRGLQFRCSDVAGASELLGVFDIIEQLYPSADSP